MCFCRYFAKEIAAIKVIGGAVFLAEAITDGNSTASSRGLTDSTQTSAFRRYEDEMSNENKFETTNSLEKSIALLKGVGGDQHFQDTDLGPISRVKRAANTVSFV